MKTLVIDSATEACSVALFDNDVLIAGDWRMLGRGHAEQLVPMIQALPENGRADRIAVALGPGSFTGVRVGLAAARALAFAWNADLVGYPSLTLIAAMALDQHPAASVTVCTTGGHGEWFVQEFDADASTQSELASLPPLDAASVARSALAAGSQSEELVTLRGEGTALQIWTDARSFHLLPHAALTTDVAPLYGRAPDARLPNLA
ncbi:MAG: tRNA (adenosine(37)-N6)-threonylcarbamoyltransferase complex dimerization subunit type 1 TsaB [Alphaproteobacteria bacterium]